MSAEIQVRHDAAGARFSAEIDGCDCELDYHVANGVMTILHTGVPVEVGGRGIASAMTTAAFEWSKRQGFRIRPACSYAATFARRHPEYAELMV